MPTFVISGKKDNTGQKQYAGVRMWTLSLMGTKKCKGGFKTKQKESIGVYTHINVHLLFLHFKNTFLQCDTERFS